MFIFLKDSGKQSLAFQDCNHEKCFNIATRYVDWLNKLQIAQILFQ